MCSKCNLAMKSNIISRISKILFFAFLFFSCSSDLDFDQVKDLKLEPVFVANLAYFDIPANHFISDGSEQIIPDVQEFGAFKEKFFRDHLTKIELDYEINNTIVRAFTVDVLLIDDNDQVLETTSFKIPAYSGGINVIKYPTEVFENQRLDLLKQATKMGFIVKMDAGPPLDENSIGNLKFRSSATVYMEIE